MPSARLPTDEAHRLAALHALDILDTSAEEEFDALVRVAALVCHTPISLLSLVDSERQWFKARVGLDIQETARSVAFCAHAIHGDAILEVPDAREDQRFADNALVTGEPNIRFYAGVPLKLSSGDRLGTLCVIDSKPRTLHVEQQEILLNLANAAVRMLESRRVAAESKLSEERFRALSEASPFAVFAADPEGKLTYMNLAWARMFGSSEADWMASVDLADRARVAAAWSRIDDHRDAPEIEFSLTPVAGLPRRVRALWRTMFDRRGRSIGRTGTVEDITLRLVGQAALSTLNSDLREQSTRKNRFMATLAHELRGPLSAIRSGVSLLRLDTLPPDRVANTVAMIDRQTASMTAQIDGLTDTSAISLGKIKFAPTTLDLAEIISHAVETSLPAIEARHHEIRLDLGTGRVMVNGDFARLVQVVGNLLVNAAKYTPPGGHIEVCLRTERDRALIDVVDDGSGLDAGQLKVIFELFEQVQEASTIAIDGIGIGLTLARQLCELHGGTIDVESSGKGHGSRFTVCLPLSAPAGSAAEPPLP